MARTGTQFAKITGNYTNANIYATWQLRSTDTTNKIFKIRLREYLTISGSATYESSSSTFKLNGTTIKSGSYSYSKGDHLLGYKDIDVVALADGSFPDTKISVYAKSFHFPATTKTATLTSDDIPKMELGSSITNITTTFEYPAVGMIEGVLINTELLEEYTTKLKATLNGITYNLLDNVTIPEISVYFDEGTYNDNQEIDGDDSVLFPLSNLEIAELIPNDKQINITFTLDTYDGNELKGTSSQNYVFEITAGSFSAYPILNNDSTTTALTGDTKTFILDFSSIIVKPGVIVSNNGATIKEYIYTRTLGETATIIKSLNDTCTFDSPQLNDTFTVSVIDSRGYEAVLGTIRIDNENYFLLDYLLPQFTSLTIERPEQTAPYVEISLNGSFWNGNFGAKENALTLEYRYKLSNQSDFNDWVLIQPTINENSFSYNGTIENISANLSALFEIRATDTTTSQDLRTNISIPKGKSMFDWAEDYFSFNGELCINDDEVPCFQEDSVETDGSRNITLYDSQGNKLNVATPVKGEVDAYTKAQSDAKFVQKETGKGLFSGSYDDLTNKPTIPTVPTNISSFTNDSGYITADDIPDSIEELTSPVRIWDLEEGIYQLPASCKIYYYGSSNTSNSFTVNSTSTLFVSKQSSYKYYFIIGGSSLVNYLYYGYSISSSGTKNSLELDDIKAPTSTLAQYNLGYYSTTSTITNLNSTSYVNPGMYGMSINSGTGVPSEITSSSSAILMVLANKQAPSGVTYIRQDLYVPSLSKHWTRNVVFNASSYEYPEWEEVVEDLSDYALKTEIPDVSSKQETLVSGTNIKTINGETLLGSGDLKIEAGSSIPELTSNFNVWELESGIYYVAPNVTMTNYTMFYSDIGTAVGITESESMSSITIQLAKAFLIVHNYYEGMGMVEFTLFMMGEAPTVISGMTMYQEGIAMGGTIIGGDFVLFQKLMNKQDKLVSGTSIKTINNQSLLGSGNITIEGGTGGGIETLSGSARLWDLSQGVYLIAPSTVIQYYGATGSSSFTLSGGGVLSISDGNGSYKGFQIVTGEGAEAYIYLGATSSTYGFYAKLSRVNLQNAKACTYASSQNAVGYYNATGNVSSLNTTMYLQPNEWSITVSNTTTGAPSSITGSTKVYLSVKAPGFAGSGLSSSLMPYLRQDMYAPSLNKHWYRIINYSDSSNVDYGEWVEIKETVDCTVYNVTGDATSVASATAKTIATLTIPAGTYIIEGHANFAANSTGVRKIYIGTQADYYSNTRALADNRMASNHQATMSNISTILTFAEDTTYYLNVYQNSGSSLSCSGSLRAVRIGNYAEYKAGL